MFVDLKLALGPQPRMIVSCVHKRGLTVSLSSYTHAHFRGHSFGPQVPFSVYLQEHKRSKWGVYSFNLPLIIFMTDIIFSSEHLQRRNILHLDIMFTFSLELMAFVLSTKRWNVGLVFDVVLTECPISPDMMNYIFAAHITCVNGLPSP